jgi:hypothetical protein
VLIPPPRVHRHRYAGVLAPNSPCRAQVTAWAEERVASPSPSAQPVAVSATPVPRSPARYLWAMLLARLYEAFPLVCPVCQTEMRLLAFVTDNASITPILAHLGEPTRPPPVSPLPRRLWAATERGIAALTACRRAARPLSTLSEASPRQRAMARCPPRSLTGLHLPQSLAWLRAPGCEAPSTLSPATPAARTVARGPPAQCARADAT